MARPQPQPSKTRVHKASDDLQVERLHKGYAQSMEVTRVLADEQSRFQHIRIFDTVANGRVMTLDDIVQITSRDESAYADLLTHLPMLEHGKVSSVMIVGGGDLSIADEALKHKSVKEVVLVDIDERVIALCKKHFGEVNAKAFKDRRMVIEAADAFEYLGRKSSKNRFDLIIADRATAVPAEVFNALPALKVVMRSAIDIRNIDQAAASKAGVLVTHAEAGFVKSVVELTVGFLVDLSRGITRAATSYHRGEKPEIRIGRQLSGSTVGIIGYGRISRDLAPVLAALGMKVMVSDPYAQVDDRRFARHGDRLFETANRHVGVHRGREGGGQLDVLPLDCGEPCQAERDRVRAGTQVHNLVLSLPVGHDRADLLDQRRAGRFDRDPGQYRARRVADGAGDGTGLTLCVRLGGCEDEQTERGERRDHTLYAQARANPTNEHDASLVTNDEGQ